MPQAGPAGSKMKWSVASIFVEAKPSGLTVATALDRSLQEITPSKKTAIQYSERNSVKTLKSLFASSTICSSIGQMSAYFRPLWTVFQADHRRHFKFIVDAISN